MINDMEEMLVGIPRKPLAYRTSFGSYRDLRYAWSYVADFFLLGSKIFGFNSKAKPNSTANLEC
jgi:hypothetical protein